jgi:hypothetical protein
LFSRCRHRSLRLLLMVHLSDGEAGDWVSKIRKGIGLQYSV